MLLKRIELLKDIGFSDLEADAYLALLSEPGSTGYRIAQIIGKPVPNTYKTLDNLENRGAIIADHSGRSRLYSAVPIGDFIDSMVRGLESSRKMLQKELSDVGTLPPEEGIYRLQNVQQVYSKAESMIASANTSLLIDIDPIPLRQLEPSIDAAVERGLKPLVHVHSDSMNRKINGCEVINSCKLDWPGEWLVVHADGREYLIAVITPDERRVLQAVWSRNAFIAPLVFHGTLDKAILYSVMIMFGKGLSRDEIQTEMRRLWTEFAQNDPGSQTLRELFDTLRFL